MTISRHPPRRHGAGRQHRRSRPRQRPGCAAPGAPGGLPGRDRRARGGTRRAARPGAGTSLTGGHPGKPGRGQRHRRPVRTGHGGLLERYLRTDATPYPGFSGGPLVDTAGRVVGLNTSGLGRGAAITIPAALAWEIASTLAKHGHVRRGFIGVRSQPVADRCRPAESPGARAGLRIAPGRGGG